MSKTIENSYKSKYEKEIKILSINWFASTQMSSDFLIIIFFIKKIRCQEDLRIEP